MTNRPKSGRLTNRNLRFLNLSCKERGYTREERPHGGYKGVSKQYPLSVLAFDKPADYMTGVKKTVNDRYEEEKQRRLNAPAWVSWANRVKNHTGEQALIVQKYLAGNKLEQSHGVVPSYTEKMRVRCDSALSDPDTMLVKSNSMHQYLTSTDRYGESAQMVDVTLGRPTRASLLRVHHRSQSAPQVRAPLENKIFLHRQQMMAIKKEDKYKTADVPKDLQPITQNGESIYEFLVGARYNRSYCADATCMSKLGLYVSKDDPIRCFLHRPFQVSPSGKPGTSRQQRPQSSLTVNSHSTNAFNAQQNSEASPPLRAKFAWETDESVATSGRSTPGWSTPGGRSTPSLNSTPRIRKNISKGEASTNRIEKDKKSHGHEDGYCVMCHGGMPKRPILSKKQNGVRRKDQEDDQECDDHNQDENWKRSYINLLEQNYHLNITGTRVDFTNTKPSTARGSLHHSSSSTLYRQSKKTIGPQTNRNNNRSSISFCSESLTTRSTGDRSSNGIHVDIPVMSTSGEVDLPVKGAPNHVPDNFTCKFALVAEDQKEVDCPKEVGCPKEVTDDSSSHQTTAAEQMDCGKQTTDVSVKEKKPERVVMVPGNQPPNVSVKAENEPERIVMVPDNQPRNDGELEMSAAQQTECGKQSTDVSVKEKEPEEAGVMVSDNKPQNDGEPEASAAQPTVCGNLPTCVSMKEKEPKRVVMVPDIQPPNDGEPEASVAEPTEAGNMSV